jgi:hypothetical protein
VLFEALIGSLVLLFEALIGSLVLFFEALIGSLASSVSNLDELFVATINVVEFIFPRISDGQSAADPVLERRMVSVLNWSLSC